MPSIAPQRLGERHSGLSKISKISALSPPKRDGTASPVACLKKGHGTTRSCPALIFPSARPMTLCPSIDGESDGRCRNCFIRWRTRSPGSSWSRSLSSPFVLIGGAYAVMRSDYITGQSITHRAAGAVQPRPSRRPARHRLPLLPHLGGERRLRRHPADPHLHDLPFAALHQRQDAGAGARKAWPTASRSTGTG